MTTTINTLAQSNLIEMFNHKVNNDVQSILACLDDMHACKDVEFLQQKMNSVHVLLDLLHEGYTSIEVAALEKALLQLDKSGC